MVRAAWGVVGGLAGFVVAVLLQMPGIPFIGTVAVGFCVGFFTYRDAVTAVASTAATAMNVKDDIRDKYKELRKKGD